MKGSRNLCAGFLAMWFAFETGTCFGAAPIMVEKNLFAQDRKPPSEQAAPTPQANQPGLQPKSIQLDGVFICGDVKKALIRLKGQPSGKDKSGKAQSPFVMVREGEKLAEYQVVRIEPRSVSLEKDGQTYVVSLFAEGKVVPPAPQTPQPPGTASAGQGSPPPGGPSGRRERLPAPSHGGEPPEVTSTPRFPTRGGGSNVMARPPAVPHTDGGSDESVHEEVETEDMDEDES